MKNCFDYFIRTSSLYLYIIITKDLPQFNEDKVLGYKSNYYVNDKSINNNNIIKDFIYQKTIYRLL